MLSRLAFFLLIRTYKFFSRLVIATKAPPSLRKLGGAEFLYQQKDVKFLHSSFI